MTTESDSPTSAPSQHSAGGIRVPRCHATLGIAWLGGLALLLMPLVTAPLQASDGHEHQHPTRHRSLADNRVRWPTWDEVTRVVSLRDYNTRTVLTGTVLLGISAGLVGVFMLLRRRSLIGDVVSHASLPGIGIAFIVMEALEPGSGKSLSGLLTGALVAGLLGILSTKLILRYSRIKEDAALAIVLSVFFGLGIAMFTIVQNIPSGNAAGLNHFIFGKAASMVAADVTLIRRGAIAVVVIYLLLFKEFSLMSFDEKFAAAQGWPVFLLDMVLMGLVTGVTVIGLQSVGILLVVAMLIIPAAAARFWTHHLASMTLISAGIGGGSALLGVIVSALFPRLAAGAVIVLMGSACFMFSMFFGWRRGILVRLQLHWKMKNSVGRDHLLRALFECLEQRCETEDQLDRALTDEIVHLQDLMQMRSWSSTRLATLLRTAQRAGLVVSVRTGFRLTQRGAESARRVVRNHRLWELYLIEYADIAPNHVDRDADDIEHLLGPEVIGGLERLLDERFPQLTVPPSPHTI